MIGAHVATGYISSGPPTRSLLILLGSSVRLASPAKRSLHPRTPVKKSLSMSPPASHDKRQVQLPRVLSIAGSDSGGGAGIQADIKTLTSLSCYALTALTALTSQTTVGVHGIHSLPPSFVFDQIVRVVEDIGVDAVKVGMLESPGVAKVVGRAWRQVWECETRLKMAPTADDQRADGIAQKRPALPPIVLDPVMVSTSGHVLLASDAIDAIMDDLLPLCAVLTPNLHEAGLLLSRARSRQEHRSEDGDEAKDQTEQLDSVPKLIEAARKLADLGPQAVLLKGGHGSFTKEEWETWAMKHGRDARTSGPSVSSVDGLDLVIHDSPSSASLASILSPAPSPTLSTLFNALARTDDANVVVDVLYERSLPGKQLPRCMIMARPKIESESTHGTGCTLSAALAGGLAKGMSVQEATVLAIEFTQRGIAAGLPIGQGHGPLNHMHSIIERPIPQPTRANPYPFVTHLIRSCQPLWRRYVQHPFVLQLGQGTLPERAFVQFLRQDYRFLLHYARIHGLAAYKSSNWADVQAFGKIAQNIAEESEMHEQFCARWGISKEELVSTEETARTIAYTRFVSDVGHQGSLLDLIVATSPCLLGYGEASLWIQRCAEKGEEGVRREENRYWEWVEDYTSDWFQGAVKEGIESLERRVALDPPSPLRVRELENIFQQAVKLEIGFWDEPLETIA